MTSYLVLAVSHNGERFMALPRLRTTSTEPADHVCAEGGDSGGSLFAGDTALGVTSGGSGNCTTGSETFFQPAQPAAFMRSTALC